MGCCQSKKPISGPSSYKQQECERAAALEMDPVVAKETTKQQEGPSPFDKR